GSRRQGRHRQPVERPACRCQPTPRAALAPRRGPRRPAQRLGPPRPREVSRSRSAGRATRRRWAHASAAAALDGAKNSIDNN
ncbi:unnamed protein product, partial [Prorocentrum cordatum]